MVNIFVHRHPGPRSNRLDDTGHFHFRDLEEASWRSPNVKFVYDLDVTRKGQTKVKGQDGLLLTGQLCTFLFIGTLGLGAIV